MLHLNPTGSTQVHAVHFSVAPSDRRQFPAAISADEKFAGSAAVTRQERIRGFSTTRTRHLFVNSSIETEGGRKKRRVSVPSQHLKKMETCLTSYIPNFETLFLSRCLKKVFKGWNEVEAEVHDCCELYNNERIFKKFRFENCKSLKFFILRSERYSVEGVTRDFKKEHDTIMKGISSFSTLHLPGYGCPADVALGWKSMPLPMPLYRAVSTMVLKCLVYTSPGRFHLIFLCLRFDFYCYRRCTKNPENRLPRDPRCCADAGSTRFDLCRRTNKSRYEMKLFSIIKIIITFVQSKNYS